LVIIFFSWHLKVILLDSLVNTSPNEFSTSHIFVVLNGDELLRCGPVLDSNETIGIVSIVNPDLHFSHACLKVDAKFGKIRPDLDQLC